MQPCSALAHVGQHRAHGVPGAGQADVDRLVPDLVRRLPHRGEAGHARVGQARCRCGRARRSCGPRTASSPRGRGRRPRRRGSGDPSRGPSSPFASGPRRWRCGRGSVLTGSEMSQKAMSHPLWAKVSAWLRPWPRAPPVISATLPSNSPITASFASATLQGPGLVAGPDRPGSDRPVHGSKRSAGAPRGCGLPLPGSRRPLPEGNASLLSGTH